MSITKLKSSELYRVCDPKKFDFTSTAELEERMSALGQDRAISAVELGINVKSKGYNLFCLGPEGTGKTSLVKRVLEKESKNRPTPKDWAYVYNFDEPYKPKAISFPAGTASDFAKDIDKIIDEFSTAIPSILESEEYKAAESIIKERFKQKKEEYIKILQKKAKGRSVSILQMQVGLVVAPMKNGEVRNELLRFVFSVFVYALPLYSRHIMVRSSNCSASPTKASTARRTLASTSLGAALGSMFRASIKRPVPNISRSTLVASATPSVYRNSLSPGLSWRVYSR